MQFQLILQFPANSLADFDSLVALEDDMIVQVDDLAEVDGHDFGAEQMNIFVLTSEPEASFERVKDLLSQHGLLEKVTAAYRPIDGEHYSILWPKLSQRVFKIA